MSDLNIEVTIDILGHQSNHQASSIQGQNKYLNKSFLEGMIRRQQSEQFQQTKMNALHFLKD